MKIKHCWLIAASLAIAACGCNAQARDINASSANSRGSQSPAFVVNDKGRVSISFGEEKIGKKIAIRRAYLLPFFGFNKEGCTEDVPRSKCGDLQEATRLYLEIQSIWPQPVLLTAAHLEKVSFTSDRPTPGFYSDMALGEKITSQSRPSNFLFQPGEVKLISLFEGVRLDGVTEFFTTEVRSEPISGEKGHFILHNLERVSEFNQFLERKFGKKAALRITIYEKDYQPILRTSFLLADGGDMFSSQVESSGSRYKLQHDRFLAETLFLLEGKNHRLSGD